jgi:hypothetical protein
MKVQSSMENHEQVLLTWLKCIDEMKATSQPSFTYEEAEQFALKFKIPSNSFPDFLNYMKKVNHNIFILFSGFYIFIYFHL